VNLTKEPNNSIKKMPYFCDYCRFSCQTRRGLRQHIDKKPECLAKEKAGLGITDLSAVCNRKAPPVASIPTKRTFEQTDVGQGFDLSSLDLLLGYHGKAKRTRCSYVAGWETFKRSQYSDTMEMKLLTSLPEIKLRAFIDKCLPESASPNDPQGMEIEDEEQQAPGILESSSEDELEIVGGPHVDDIWDNSEAQDQVSLTPLDPPEVPPVPPEAPPVPPDALLNPPNVDGPDYNHDRTINAQPNTTMRDRFKIYCRSRQGLLENTFTIAQKRAV
jgi:hypothetical protein